MINTEYFNVVNIFHTFYNVLRSFAHPGPLNDQEVINNMEVNSANCCFVFTSNTLHNIYDITANVSPSSKSSFRRLRKIVGFPRCHLGISKIFLRAV